MPLKKIMNIKRFIARAAIGGHEPKIIRELEQHAQALRQDEKVVARWNKVAEEVARENRRVLVPVMILTATLTAGGSYYLRYLIEPAVSVATIIGVHMVHVALLLRR